MLRVIDSKDYCFCLFEDHKVEDMRCLFSVRNVYEYYKYPAK